jgi:hypothetical protein
MLLNLTVLILLFLSAALLVITFAEGDVFPNVALTWSLRIVSLLIILGVFAIFRWRKLKNL